MKVSCPLALAATVLVVGGCAADARPTPSESPSRTGIRGAVLLGPQCPVEVAGEPCPDEPPADAQVTVTLARATGSGADPAIVAEGLTNARGRFRVVAPPGVYTVSADAGMSCEPVEVTVPDRGFATVQILCDTGIR